MSDGLISETFATSERYLAAYLIANGIEFTGVGFDGRYTTFMFPSKKVGKMDDAFDANSAIPVQDFIRAYERVQDIISANRRRGD